MAFDHAQAFTTGSNAMGYSLTSVGIFFNRMSIAGDTGFSFSPTVTVREPDTNNSNIPSDTSLGTLTNPTFTAGTTGEYTFTSTSGISLDANKTYWIVLISGGNESNVTVSNTGSDDEDSGGATGFSIANDSKFRSTTA